MPKAISKKEPVGLEAVMWENPLLPNKKLRSLYTAMVELRLLEEHIGTLRRRAPGNPATRGEEGCRVSTTIDLKPGDLTSEAASGPATGFLRGATLQETMQSTDLAAMASTGQLPPVAKTLDRLHLAMGAALTLKATRKGALLICYTHSNEAWLAEWKPLLRFAAKQILPTIFVVLPAAPSTKATTKPGQLSLASTRCGVPGITVDSADPVALYRVAQESMLRARAGGGPVLIESIAFQLAGRKLPPADPIETMREFLLHRRIVDQAWLQSVEARFMARLEASQRPSTRPQG